MASVISEVQDKENQSIPTSPAENDTKKDAKKQPEVHAKEEENVEELQYLKLIQDILDRGMRRGDRTGTGTISVFGTQQRYSLRDGTIPLLTTKRVFWKAIVGELLWFISGSTDSKKLSEKGIKIWDANGSREFLDNLGFHDRREGDLGPVYGFQWRHFGAEYRGPDVDYTGEGVDQLAQVIDTIKNDPNSRRIILSAWNPKDLDKMALPPCHSLAQFYVCDGELSCMLYQRSGDVGLGIPFNIASYSLFTHMIAFVTGLKPGDFVHTIADTHIYNNHEEPLREQIKRTPRPFPKLRFVNVENIKTIDDFTEENIVLEGYRPYPTIKMNMAV